MIYLKEDMLNEYYYLPQKLYEDIQATFDDLKRTDASNTDGNDKHQSEEDVETAEAETKSSG